MVRIFEKGAYQKNDRITVALDGGLSDLEEIQRSFVLLLRNFDYQSLTSTEYIKEFNRIVDVVDAFSMDRQGLKRGSLRNGRFLTLTEDKKRDQVYTFKKQLLDVYHPKFKFFSNEETEALVNGSRSPKVQSCLSVVRN